MPLSPLHLVSTSIFIIMHETALASMNCNGPRSDLNQKKTKKPAPLLHIYLYKWNDQKN